MRVTCLSVCVFVRSFRQAASGTPFTAKSRVEEMAAGGGSKSDEEAAGRYHPRTHTH